MTRKMKVLERKVPEKLVIVVGYEGVEYAIFVHEIMRYRHDEPTKAQFLRDPLMDIVDEKIAFNIIKEQMANNGDFRKALWKVAQEIKKQSRQEVPVDTGRLRSSLFVSDESEMPEE